MLGYPYNTKQTSYIIVHCKIIEMRHSAPILLAVLAACASAAIAVANEQSSETYGLPRKASAGAQTPLSVGEAHMRQAGSEPGAAASAAFDYFYLVRQWPATFCNDHSCSHSPPRK